MIAVQRLTAEGFAPFGTAALRPSMEATASGNTFTYWSDVAHFQIDGETEIGFCTVYAQDPAVVDWMERHDRTPELLVPIDAPFVLPVMTDDGAVEAFKVDLGRAVAIGQGVWHSACKPVGSAEATYFVIFRRGTPGDDVIKTDIEPIAIDLV